MSRRTFYEVTYARLEEIFQRPLAGLEPGDHFKLKAPGFMDLSCEVLPECSETGGKVVSICHYYLQNGDLCQDPEMTIRLFPPGSTAFNYLVPSSSLSLGRAEALMFQQSNPPIYQVTYPSPGRYYPKLRKELNQFLRIWLTNIKEQGHQPEKPD